MIFVDTVAWLYLFDKGQNAKTATELQKFVAKLDESFCTSDLVIAETHKWLVHHGRPIDLANKVLEALASEEPAQILTIDPVDRSNALKLIKKFADQKLSFVDAITVCQMHRSGIKKILSYDKHFLLFPNINRLPQ